MMDPPPLLTSSSPAEICCLIPSLPDDLAILCIARVPRSRHPFLASVSRAWRAFLRSPLFFSVRLEIGASEHFHFINICTPTNQSQWFLLDRTRLDYSPPPIPLPAQPYVFKFQYSVVALGHSLFLLGGSINGKRSNVVQIYDARFNCWRLGPSMLAPRKVAAVGVISGRIYVVGGCSRMTDYWAEEFDPEKQLWRRISSPPEVRKHWLPGYAVIGGKLFLMAKSKFVIFDPVVAASEVQATQEKAWTLVPNLLNFGMPGSLAALGEVLYSYSKGKKIKWYDFTKAEWKNLEGIPKEKPLFLYGPRVAKYGDLLCLVWGGRKGKQMEVFSIGVSVMKTDNGSLRGSIEWSDTFVLPFPTGTLISNCISLEF